VQVLPALDASEVGLHATEETVLVGAVRLMEVLAEAPFKVAVTVAV
jgi:hypothetical protein